MNDKRKALEVQDYDIAVTGRHLLVTEPMKDYAFDKMSKIDRFHLRISDVHVTMDVQREQCRVDIYLQANNVKIKSSASTNDMYASLDMAVDKLQTQLRRYKRRLTEHHRKNLTSVDINVNVLRPYNDELAAVNEDIEDETRRREEDKYRIHEIVAKETTKLKSLTYDEAVMKMELSGDFFLIFRNQEDTKLKVIYRRNDGNYGVIEPE